MACAKAALAQKRIGEPASGKYDGAFLAVRVGKKNSGRFRSRVTTSGAMITCSALPRGPDARQEENDGVDAQLAWKRWSGGNAPGKSR